MLYLCSGRHVCLVIVKFNWLVWVKWWTFAPEDKLPMVPSSVLPVPQCSGMPWQARIWWNLPTLRHVRDHWFLCWVGPELVLCTFYIHQLVYTLGIKSYNIIKCHLKSWTSYVLCLVIKHKTISSHVLTSKFIGEIKYKQR